MPHNCNIYEYNVCLMNVCGHFKIRAIKKDGLILIYF